MVNRKPAAKAASTNTQAKAARPMAPRLDSPSRSLPMGLASQNPLPARAPRIWPMSANYTSPHARMSPRTG